MSKSPMLNEALKLVRLYWGETQAETSKKLDVSQSLISEIENGQKPVTMDLLERYSRAFDIKMSQLMFFAEELEGQPPVSRGRLIVAGRVLEILERMSPSERAEA